MKIYSLKAVICVTGLEPLEYKPPSLHHHQFIAVIIHHGSEMSEHLR